MVAIPFGPDTRITDVAGRTIKSDGSIVPLGKDAVLERTILKFSGVRVKEKTFTMPGVEPGAIIEYRYRENQIPIFFRSDIKPVPELTQVML